MLCARGTCGTMSQSLEFQLKIEIKGGSGEPLVVTTAGFDASPMVRGLLEENERLRRENEELKRRLAELESMNTKLRGFSSMPAASVRTIRVMATKRPETPMPVPLRGSIERQDEAKFVASLVAGPAEADPVASLITAPSPPERLPGIRVARPPRRRLVEQSVCE